VGWLREQGLDSDALPTRFEGERDDADLDEGPAGDESREASS
jgi:hypothetical protein